MQLYPNRLSQSLQGQLPGFVLVFGEEPQQKLDSIAMIRQQAQQQGFDERQSLVADAQFEWSRLIEASQTMSLFATKQVIELELPTGKPGKEGSKTLLTLAEQNNPDILFIIHGPKVGKDVTATKWFKTLDKQGWYIPCYALEGDRLRSWLSDTMRQHGLQPSAPVTQFFMDYFEGNLLAAKQEIQKLVLLYPDGQVQTKDIEKLMVEQSRFNVFQLADTLLSGDASKAIKLLTRLEAEGIEPNIILWALIREWQTLSTLKFAQSQRQSLDSLWNKLRIWQNRKGLYLNALNRLPQAQLDEMQHKLSQLDQAFKQSQVTRPFVELSHICLLFTPMQLSSMPIDFNYSA